MEETIYKASSIEEINKYVDTSKKMLAALVNDGEVQTYCIIKNENIYQQKAYWKSIKEYLKSTGKFVGMSSQMEFIKQKDLEEIDMSKIPVYVMAVDIDTLIEDE